MSEALYLKMALLHIVRRRGRSALISLMIAASLIGLLLMEGMYEGMMVQITQNSIRTGSGTVSIQHAGFRADEDLKYRLEHPEAITPLLDADPRVRSWALKTNVANRHIVRSNVRHRT